MKPSYFYSLVGVFLTLICIVFAFFTVNSYSSQSELAFQVNSLNTRLASTTALASDLNSLSEKLTAEQVRVSKLEDSLKESQKKLTSIEKNFGKVTDSLSELEKIAKADPKLLQKYSKVYFLNEHYEPARLSEIDSVYTVNTNRSETIHASVWPYLRTMLQNAEDARVPLRIASAYRSFNTQASLKTNYSVTYGAGTANQFSADQGYSEHQLGTTVDFSTPELGTNFTNFERTSAFAWLKENAYKYGFILSYPPNNQYYVYEPWHWRFVGKDLAEHLHTTNMQFYELEQRKIDEFLPRMFD
jgi:D-alanyl-D-alanine carboxypeptidase